MQTGNSQEHQDYHNKYDGGYSHNAQDDHHSYHQRYDEDKNPHANLFEVQNTKTGKLDKKTKTIIGVVVGIIVLTTMIPLFSPFIFFVAIWALVVFLNGKKKKQYEQKFELILTSARRRGSIQTNKCSIIYPSFF